MNIYHLLHGVEVEIEMRAKSVRRRPQSHRKDQVRMEEVAVGDDVIVVTLCGTQAPRNHRKNM